MTSFIIPLLAVFSLWYHSSATLAPVVPLPKPVAIVFGAGLAPKQQPSLVLQDRLDTAYDLYKKGTVDSLLLSGDSVKKTHDEVGVMKAYLVKRGVPDDKLITDPQGIDTYTTCLHAKKEFKLDTVILVTQDFHMSRAKYLCEGVGLKVNTAVADKREYDPAYTEREKTAMAKAWLLLNTDIAPNQMKQLEDAILK